MKFCLDLVCHDEFTPEKTVNTNFIIKSFYTGRNSKKFGKGRGGYSGAFHFHFSVPDS